VAVGKDPAVAQLSTLAFSNMTSPPIIIIDSVSDSSQSRLCKLKLKPSIPDIPESGGFSAELKGIEYLPGKKMDVVAIYGSIHDEIFISVTSGRRKIIGVASTLGSTFEATASIKAGTEIRIWIEEQKSLTHPSHLGDLTRREQKASCFHTALMANMSTSEFRS
jgi:hypothetical protein